MTEIATRDVPAGTLALTGDQIQWSPVQRAALEHIGIADAPTGDQQVFLHVAQRVGLDPFAKQIYMIPRRERGRDGKPDTTKWTIQTAIDGFRLIAERHDQYAGTLDPEWCGEDGVWREAWVDRKPPVAARVKVLRHDRQHPITLPVRFVEFAASFANGDLQGQWKSKPAHMIAKVAEAAALRKAFPQDLSGLYTDDEMAHADSPGGRRVVAQAPAPAVTAAELTGAPVVDAEPHTSTPAPAPQAAAAGDSGGRMTSQQSKKLFALLREAEIEDRNGWASGLLGREITSYSQLSVVDAGVLIDRLETGLAHLNGDVEPAADDPAGADS